MNLVLKTCSLCLAVGLLSSTSYGQVAIQAQTIHTAVGPPIANATIVIQAGKITAIGPSAEVSLPKDCKILQAAVVTPGLIDAHSTVGLSGILNVDGDQDQLERSDPIQPELRALDAYNSHEELIAWVRSFGVTTLHTGHAPGELISGQTMIAKTSGNTVNDAKMVDARAVAVTLASAARKEGPKSPGTRGKMISMLRAQLFKAQEYQRALAKAKEDAEADPPARDLRLETLASVLEGNLPLMVTAHRAQDIGSALRLAEEFKFELWLDGAAEAYLLIDEIRASGAAVLLHPTMARPVGDMENMSFETASKLVAAGIPMALQAGYEAYVPKTRVVLFEAGMAAAHGLSFDQALQAITIHSAKILGIDDRVGSLEVGKDGDVALFDGDPFEYTTHCIGTVINGQVFQQVH